MESLPVDSYSAVPLPGGGQEENHQGINFKPSCQHVKEHNHLAEEGVAVKVSGGTNQLQTGTDIVKGSSNGSKVGGKIQAVQTNYQPGN